MKTAISIPDALNESIDPFREAAGISRSEFFQRAARTYLEKASAKAIVANLNLVHGSEDTQGDADFHKAALSHFRDIIGEEKW